MKNNIKFNRILLALSCIIIFTSPFFGADKRAVVFPFSYAGDPAKAYTVQAIKNMLGKRLSGSGIEVIADEQYNSILNEKEKSGNISAERIREAGIKLKAEFAVYGSVTTAGTSSSLDFFILDTAKKDSVPVKISEVVAEDQLIAKTAAIADQFRNIMQGGQAKAGEGAVKGRLLSSLEVTGSFKLKKSQVMSFDIADLNKDGNNELILLEQSIIRIFVKENNAWVQKDSLESSAGEIFLKVSVGDADGNDIPEIYIMTLYGATMQTGVWEWQGKFKILFREKGSIRVIKDASANKPKLLFQDTKYEEPFIDMMYFMEYDKKGKLIRGEPLKQFNKVQFSTLLLFDLDKDGKMEFLGLDDKSYLHVWDRDGKSLWKSKEEMGGTNNAVFLEYDNFNPSSTKKYRSPLTCSPVVMDIDRDGQEEIIVVQNSSSLSLSERTRTYEKGYFYIYKIEGKKLTNPWTSQEMNNCITEIQSDGRTLYLSTEDGLPVGIFKGTSEILWFD
ncbi:MAG: VCBS repeat-containing protein [Spirochaetota bacterium]